MNNGLISSLLDTCIFFVQAVNDLGALEITQKTPGISFPFHIHTDSMLFDKGYPMHTL